MGGIGGPVGIDEWPGNAGGLEKEGGYDAGALGSQGKEGEKEGIPGAGSSRPKEKEGGKEGGGGGEVPGPSGNEGGKDGILGALMAGPWWSGNSALVICAVVLAVGK